jgi:hypothetical protein
LVVLLLVSRSWTPTVVVSSSSRPFDSGASWTETTGFCRNPTYLGFRLHDIKALTIVALVRTLNRRGERRPIIIAHTRPLLGWFVKMFCKDNNHRPPKSDQQLVRGCQGNWGVAGPSMVNRHGDDVRRDRTSIVSRKENLTENASEKNVRNFDNKINLNQSMVRNRLMHFHLVSARDRRLLPAGQPMTEPVDQNYTCDDRTGKKELC